MTQAVRKKESLTEGPIFSKMLLFILPLMASNLLQTLYNAADMMVVGLSNEPNAVGAIGTTSSLTHLIVHLFIGFSTGAGVMVARHLGAKKDDAVQKTVHTSLLMSLILGVVGGLLGFAISRPVLHLMGADRSLLDLATLYAKIYFCGLPFLSVTNFSAAILRAKGDTKTPLYILSLSGALNVLLNLMFVLVFDLSVEGVALATAIANAASAVLLVAKLTKDDGACRLMIKRLGIYKDAVKDILHVGLPAGIQSALFSLSNLLIQSSILQVNGLLTPAGSDFAPIVKGNAAAGNLENFAFTAVNAVHQASITFTGQNAGAEKRDRVKRVVLLSYLTSLTLATVFTLTIYLLKAPLFSLYDVIDAPVGSLEHIAYEAASLRLSIHLLSFPIFAFMDTGSGIARGLKKAISTTVITLIGTCVLRVVWILGVFPMFVNLESIFISYPLSWLLTGIAQFLLVLLTLRKPTKERKIA